ncbi:MAG: PQQ-binding-like beta-propeller repeat protein, partial [Panacagrimonas sp.]
MKKDSSTTAPGAAVRTLRAMGVLVSAIVSLALAAPTVSADAHRQMGMKYSPLEQVNAKNVSQLVKAWEYRTGEISHDNKVLDSFQDEPSIVDGNLIVCTTSRRLIALDPATGAQRWVHDPKSKPTGMRKCRGITTWTDPQAANEAMCKTRILLGTADYRLVAVDSKTGRSCPDFGKDGVVEMPTSKPILWPGEVAAASRPAVVNGVVV